MAGAGKLGADAFDDLGATLNDQEKFSKIAAMFIRDLFREGRSRSDDDSRDQGQDNEDGAPQSAGEDTADDTQTDKVMRAKNNGETGQADDADGAEDSADQMGAVEDALGDQLQNYEETPQAISGEPDPLISSHPIQWMIGKLLRYIHARL